MSEGERDKNVRMSHEEEEELEYEENNKRVKGERRSL